MSDFLPCLFVPPLDGCDLSGYTTNSALRDIPIPVEWLDGSDRLDGMIDSSLLGLSGHSAGGRSTGTIGTEDDRFVALLPLAYDASITRDVPTLYLDGSCDGYVPTEDVESVWQESGGDSVSIQGAGHLAFSDICAVGLDQMARDHFGGRDDVNQSFLDQLIRLATDGCPGNQPTVERAECASDYLPIDDSHPIIRHYATVFFDEALYGIGDGVQDGVFGDAVVR